MNNWTEKSFALAKEKGYLDRIFKIYPIEQSDSENIVEEDLKKEIKNLLDTHKPKELIKLLLTFKRFPFDEPYIGFLRHHKESLDKNPLTIKRIFERLQKINFQGIVDGINRPKSASRKMGNSFTSWLYKNFKVLDEAQFVDSNTGIVVLHGGDRKLANFAKKYLKYDRKKGLDFVIKKDKTYIIGEAKFVSNVGGTQDKSVREVIGLIKYDTKNKFIIVGLIDGVPWVSTSALSKSLHELKENQHIMSALYLKDFLDTKIN